MCIALNQKYIVILVNTINKVKKKKATAKAFAKNVCINQERKLRVADIYKLGRYLIA